MTQQLSPAAKEVLTAVTLTKYDVPPEGLPAFAEEMAPLLAAALRAAADQMSSHHSKAYLYSLADGLKLLAIAEDLEAQ
jgi:hypothetical protein